MNRSDQEIVLENSLKIVENGWERKLCKFWINFFRPAFNEKHKRDLQTILQENFDQAEILHRFM